MAAAYAEIIEAELMAHGISLCHGCADGKHGRARANADTRTVHMKKLGARRSTLFTFLHEVGHIVNGHGKTCRLRRWEREEQATEYAATSMRAHGISIPRGLLGSYSDYVARCKRFARNVAAGRRRARRAS